MLNYKTMSKAEKYCLVLFKNKKDIIFPPKFANNTKPNFRSGMIFGDANMGLLCKFENSRTSQKTGKSLIA